MPRKKRSPAPRKTTSLAEPFPSPPSKPGRFVLYISKGPKEGVSIFAAAYAAKKFLFEVIGDDDYVIESPTLLKSSTGLRVRAESWANGTKGCTITEIMEHEYTAGERDWVLPFPYTNTAFIYRCGKSPNKPAKKDRVQAERKERKAKKPRKPRASRDGLVTIQQIAEKLEMLPREARAILRKQKVVKPDAGWAWPQGEADDIEALMRKHSK